MLKVASVVATLMAATCPEDIFGDLSGSKADQLESIRRRYRELARLAHPDGVPPADKKTAEEAFAKLPTIREAAEQAIDAGTYGQRKPLQAVHSVVIRSRNNLYMIGYAFAAGDIANLYRCTAEKGSAGLIKVARNAADNDLLQTEASTLRHLLTPDRPEAKGFFPRLPKLSDSFSFRESSGAGPARQANVFELLPGFYSLEEVRKAYPAGISPKHMAWIWRRLLLVLGYAHARGVIHGAVLPSHVLIHSDHELMLIDWCYSVRDQKTHIPAISKQYTDWYPPEVLAKKQPSPATDIYMSARCMAYLMGAGDGGCSTSPRLRGFIASCLLNPSTRRPQNAWQLRDEFTTLIEQLWGPRTYIPFVMPK